MDIEKKEDKDNKVEKDRVYYLDDKLEPNYLSHREKFIVDLHLRGKTASEILEEYRKAYPNATLRLSVSTIGIWLKKRRVQEYLIGREIGKASLEYFKDDANRAKELRKLSMKIDGAMNKLDIAKIMAKIAQLNVIGKLFGGDGGVSIENQQINFYQSDGRV